MRVLLFATLAIHDRFFWMVVPATIYTTFWTCTKRFIMIRLPLTPEALWHKFYWMILRFLSKRLTTIYAGAA